MCCVRKPFFFFCCHVFVFLLVYDVRESTLLLLRRPAILSLMCVLCVWGVCCVHSFSFPRVRKVVHDYGREVNDVEKSGNNIEHVW